jgi:hypothetical protein
MSTNPVTHGAASTDNTLSGDRALTPNDLRNMAVTIDIFRSLAGVVALEATARSNTEKIEKLTEQVSAIPYLKENVEKNTKDLNELGRRHTKELNDLRTNEIGRLNSFVDTAKILGYIALTLAGIVATALVTYLKTK